MHVSADSRYLFYCNGVLVGRGPAKGDVNHQFYDTYHLTNLLRPGANVLAALVLDMSHVALYPAQLGAPGSVMTYAGGFVLEGALLGRGEAVLEDLRTDAGWKVAVDTAFRFQNEYTRLEGYQGYFEHGLGRLIPPGLTTRALDDSAWAAARLLYKAERIENRRDSASPYGLVVRMIPALAEEEAKALPGGLRGGRKRPRRLGRSRPSRKAALASRRAPGSTSSSMSERSPRLSLSWPPPAARAASSA